METEFQNKKRGHTRQVSIHMQLFVPQSRHGQCDDNIYSRCAWTPKIVMVASPGYSRGGACLVHDNEVDGVLLRVLVLAEPDAEALRIKALEVLRKTGQRNLNTAGLCTALLREDTRPQRRKESTSVRAASHTPECCSSWTLQGHC